MNLDTQEVSWHSQNIQLSRREYSLLETFLRHPNQILKNEELIDKVYGSSRQYRKQCLKCAYLPFTA